MAFSYAITATSFALVCSLIWLMTGGTALSAIVLYLVSGHTAMGALAARAALSRRIKQQHA